MNLLERLEASATNLRVQAEAIDTTIETLKTLGILTEKKIKAHSKRIKKVEKLLDKGKKKRGRRRMTAAEKKEVSKRMKKYWRQRRKEAKEAS